VAQETARLKYICLHTAKIEIAPRNGVEALVRMKRASAARPEAHLVDLGNSARSDRRKAASTSSFFRSGK